MSYIARELVFLFGCHHSNLSRVFTLDGHSYRVCCDCGARFDYSLDTMSIQRRDFMTPAPLCVIANLKSAHSGR
jgi:uncharacterized membrane protein